MGPVDTILTIEDMDAAVMAEAHAAPSSKKHMIAIDTNVVVRFLVNDDPEQATRARRLIEAEDVFLSTTVLLEIGMGIAGRLQTPSCERA